MSQPQPSFPASLQHAIGRFPGICVLVVGDLMLDRFVNGVIERISPEAPIPVLHGRGETLALGGAGNVVANIVSLGGTAVPVSVIGNDPAGRQHGADAGRAWRRSSGRRADGRAHDLVQEPLFAR